MTRPIAGLLSPRGGHTDVSEYESPMNISLNEVLRRNADNPDVSLSLTIYLNIVEKETEEYVKIDMVDIILQTYGEHHPSEKLWIKLFV